MRSKKQEIQLQHPLGFFKSYWTQYWITVNKKQNSILTSTDHFHIVKAFQTNKHIKGWYEQVS